MRAAPFRIRVFSFENAISIGLRSGERALLRHWFEQQWRARQEDQRVALCLQESLNAGRFGEDRLLCVRREPRAASGSRPRRKDLAGSQRRGEAMLDIFLETRAVHRAVQQ